MSEVIYRIELKEHILAEHAAGESVMALALKYEPSASLIRNWKVPPPQRMKCMRNINKNDYSV